MFLAQFCPYWYITVRIQKKHGSVLNFFLDEKFAMTWLSFFNCRVMLMQSNGIHKGRY